VISSYRLTSRKIMSDYPELVPIIMQRDSALDAQDRALGMRAILDTHQVARRLCERVRMEIDARYEVIE
jgi:hypothetical protein